MTSYINLSSHLSQLATEYQKGIITKEEVYQKIENIFNGNGSMRCPLCGTLLSFEIRESQHEAGSYYFDWQSCSNCEYKLSTGSYNEPVQLDYDSLYQHRMRVSGLSDNYSFDNFDPDKTEGGDQKLKLMQYYVDNIVDDPQQPKNWVIMVGNAGTGKTHLAFAAGAEALKKWNYSGDIRKSVRFISWLEYIELSKRFQDSEAQKRSGDIEYKFSSVYLLITDDLDKAGDTDYSKQKLYTMLNNRLQTGLPTIITMNISPNEFEDDMPLLARRWGGAIYDRLVGRAKIITFTGASNRSGLTINSNY